MIRFLFLNTLNETIFVVPAPTGYRSETSLLRQLIAAFIFVCCRIEDGERREE